MKDDKKKSAAVHTNAAGTNKSEGNILDRDQPGPVSVATKEDGKPSYTHNADKSDPIDPHLSDDNPPEKASGSKNVEDDALDRDQPGPVSVAPGDGKKPSYTHNADSSDQS